MHYARPDGYYIKSDSAIQVTYTAHILKYNANYFKVRM